MSKPAERHGAEAAARVLAAGWGKHGSVAPITRGLINQTYAVACDDGRFVLQQLSPIFSASIHHNIAAVTERLAAAGVTTPRLVRTSAGELWHEHDGVWRLQTFVAGDSHDALRNPAQARSAGQLVARFHDALAGLDHSFVGMRAGVHDTEAHMAKLRGAVSEHREHRLHDRVAPLADAILAAYAACQPLLALPPIIAHGDLKVSNILFRGDTAICAIDLDTVGPLALAFELGDAWRSWCNVVREDEPPAFDLEVFAASWEGYRSERVLDAAERDSLLVGVEIICVELAARFAADALLESYFGYDAERYPSRGDHNLARAESQLALHRAVVACRAERAAILAATSPRRRT